MAPTSSSPSGAILSLPQHIHERIIAAAGAGFCGAALSCRALLSAWRTALASDPRLAASMLLSRAAVIDDPRQRALWIVSQLYSSRSTSQPPVALQGPDGTPRGVKRNGRAAKGLLSSPEGALVRALSSDQERSDYATVFVREMPPDVLELARLEWEELGSNYAGMAGGTGALHAAYSRHIGVTVEQLLRGSPPWATVLGACKARDSRALGACVAAHRACLRTWSDDTSPGLSDLGSEHTWRQPSGDRLAREAWLVRVQIAACLTIVLLGMQHDLAAAMRHFVRLYTHGVTGCSGGGASAAARGSAAAATGTTTAATAATNTACVRLPASVTQSAIRAPQYPAAASLGAAAAADAFINYLAACSLDVYDTARPPCHQRRRDPHTQGERTELLSSAPNPAALRHHHPALCGDCYILAREAVQLPQSPAAYAATHGYWPVVRLLLERLMYGVADPAAVPFSRVRQVYGDARDLAMMAHGALRGSRVEVLQWLASGSGAVVTCTVLLLWLGLLWGLAELWWVMVDLAVAVLWWYFLWLPGKLLGLVKRVLQHLRWM